MKNIDAFKRFAFVDLLLLGFASGSFAQDNPCADAPDAPKNENLLYSINGNSHEILTTEKFAQTLDASYQLVWFKSEDEPNSKGCKSVEIDRSQATIGFNPYEFFIAYQDGDCFGERARVEVEVRTAPMPAVKDIDLCKDGIFDPLDGIVATDAPNYELIWFKSPTDTAGKALSSAPTDVVDVTTPGKYTLYVAQRATTEPYAQSDLTWFYVTIYDVKAPIDASRHEYCANEPAEELKAELVADEKNYYYADEVVYVSGTAESSKFTPDTKVSISKTYDYQAYQIFTTPRSKQVCKGPGIDIGVDVIAVEKPKVNHSVSYVKSEAVSTKEFVDILVKSPDAIDDVAGQTLLWAKDQLGVYEKGSTSSSKPYYDELLPVGLVEKQDRWVKWQLVTAAGLVCESEPEKIDIIISSTPAPIVRKIEICEDVFKSGSIPSENEPVKNAVINADKGSLPDAEKYELVWFDNQQDADESMTNSSKLSLGRRTAPTLTDVFSGVDLSDPYESEWTKSLYVVQTYDDGNGNITTSPASEMKIFINAIPKLKEIAHEPVCMGPVNLTDNKYWNVFNGVKVDAEYLYNGSSVTQSATNLTKAGKYTINATSSLGCKSEPLEVQLDIRNISLEIDQKSLVNPGFELSMMVKVNFSYNENGRESKAGKVKLFWSSEENISDKPTDLGELTPDVKSFIYETGKFDGKPGDTHTITISVTDGYCMSKATHIVTVEKQSAVDPITAEKADDIVNVYTVSGALVKANVKRSEALNGLLEGIYVVGNEKMIVR
ncbi:MAG: hypothetical protein U0K71_04580 [Paludibacteraceae bacterium]|nr:hypothetical protein [Paludibacteraceae bacterium]